MEENDKGKQQNNLANFNILSKLFKEYTNTQTVNLLRLPSISFSDLNADNFRKDILDLNINEKDDFSKIITKKLDEIKNDSISQFQEQIDKINRNFNDFKKKILTFISSKERRISGVDNNLRSSKMIFRYAKQNIFKQLSKTIEICDNIINNIEKNFELLNVFFKENSLINNQKQIENFLIHNSILIENCSIVTKFNFTELDTTNLNKIEYYKSYIKYLSQKKIDDERNAKNYLIKKESLQNGLLFIMENFANIEKLRLEGINNNEFLSILGNIRINIEKNKKYKLAKLDIKNFSSLDTKMEKSLLNEIQKLTIQKGNFVNISLISKMFIENNKKLTFLSLEYINMTDIGFKALLLSLVNNPDITNTLEYLSLEGNKITMIRYDKDTIRGQGEYFHKLKSLNLSKNGIYKFEFALEILPELKFVDLTSNNIPTKSLLEKIIEIKNKLVLLNDNMFITNSQKNNNTYIEYLNERLPTFEYEIKNLNLNFTYDIEKQTHLENLKLSQSIEISLIKLDLSFCGLHTDVLVNFFKNNPKFLSLSYLNLRYNNIKGDFFEKIMSNEEICLDNINSIELSENEIVCETLEKIENLEKFIEKHNNLENMQLINTGFFTDLINNIKDKNPKNGKFKEVFLRMKKHLEDNKREFKFIINEGNASFIKQEFKNLFNFKLQ